MGYKNIICWARDTSCWLMVYKNIMCVFRLGLICTMCWARESSRISYYKSRIIRVQLSDNPYPPDFANIISYSASVYNRIWIIHTCIDIKKNLLHIRKIRIRIRSDAEIICSAHGTRRPDGPLGFPCTRSGTGCSRSVPLPARLGLDIKPARLVSGSARYSSTRYASTCYSSLYKQARKLARLGSLVARASSFGSRARV